MATVSALSLLSFFLLFPTLCLSQNSDANALIKFKNSLKNGDPKLDNWKSGSSPCKNKWVGVMCRREKIIGLHLTNMGLSGSIDVKPLVQLDSLRTISLINNKLEGSIPEFNKLGHLTGIYLSNNNFTGDIPHGFFGSMGTLKKVWLNENSFTGEIPDSFMQLPNLLQLKLGGNRFSGKIPSFENPDMLQLLDLKNNRLEGEIPEGLSKFKASAFQGNVGLCGKPLEKQCADENSNKPTTPDEKPKSSKSNSVSTSTVTIITLFIVAFFVIVPIIWIRGDNDDELFINRSTSSSESLREVYVAESTRAKSIGSRSSYMTCCSGNMTSGWSTTSKHEMPDLIMVNNEKGSFGLTDLMKAGAEMLGNGGLGSAYKAVMPNGLAIVVKRMRDMNRFEKEKFEAQMQRFGNFKHHNVLTPLAFHFRTEEKFIVSEYVPCGSLLYALHGDRGILHAKLNWENRLKIIKGIAQGLGYIHKELSNYEVPHGNLKTSNILLNENYDPLLSDYGFHPFINSDNLVQGLFASKSPEYLQNQKVTPKSDVYCFGIVILEIMTGEFPSQYLNSGNGGIDLVQWVQSSISENHVDQLIDPEISSDDSGLIDQMVQIIRIGAACTETNPDQRLNMKEVISKIQEVH